MDLHLIDIHQPWEAFRETRIWNFAFDNKIKIVLQQIVKKELAPTDRPEINHQDEALGCTISLDP